MDSWYTTKKDRSFYGLYFMGQNAVYTFTYMFLATYLLLCAILTFGISPEQHDMLSVYFPPASPLNSFPRVLQSPQAGYRAI